MREIIFQKKEKVRLDKFLSQELSASSRSQIQKLIKAGRIEVNSEKTVVHHFLKPGDKITVAEKIKEPVTEEITQPIIIAETEDYLVINKPSGVIVHPAKGIRNKTLTDWLIKNYPKIKNIGDDPQRPGLVHRLDKEVSGLMVIAKNQKMFNNLKSQFQNHQIKKEYRGLVYGKMEANEGQIDFPLKRSKLTGKIVAKPKNSEGREALTKFEVIKRLVNYTFLKLTLLTGRTHQIRAHLHAYRHPLVGDRLYKNKKIKEKFNLNRIFLHSTILGFNDLQGNWQEFKSDLPQELNNILNTLK